jgi:C_GCAxxG_C_C family probable redox protein
METIKDKAITSFRSGLNCAQAVLVAYSNDLGLDQDVALSVSCGFGGGMGRLQETCGAVTGSFMTLSVYNSKKHEDNKVRKDKTYAMIQQFSHKFKAIHGALDCKTLLNCDLKTKEGQQFLAENKLTEKVCEKCITDSVDIVKELMEG